MRECLTMLPSFVSQALANRGWDHAALLVAECRGRDDARALIRETGAGPEQVEELGRQLWDHRCGEELRLRHVTRRAIMTPELDVQWRAAASRERRLNDATIRSSVQAQAAVHAQHWTFVPLLGNSWL